jgi:hypothetical protein
MGSPRDLMGKSGAGGVGPKKGPSIIQPVEKKEGADHSATKQKPVKDSRPSKGAGPAGGGGAPTSVRPKV